MEDSCLLNVPANSCGSGSCESGATIRFMMADSSSQRGRSFQLTSMQAIRASRLRRSYRDAADLAALWHRAIIKQDKSHRSVHS